MIKIKGYKDMKFKENVESSVKETVNWEGRSTAGVGNAFTLTGISLLWGQMLGLLNPWFTIGTVLCLLLGFSQEVTQPKKQLNGTLTLGD